MAIRGVGLGLRWDFLDELLSGDPGEIDFVEVSPENYMRRGGHIPRQLERVRTRYPVLTHGLTMSLGGNAPLDAAYLRELAAFRKSVESPWHSDHLCFGSDGKRLFHDLLPIAFKEPEIAKIADRVRHAQDTLGIPMAIENISFYMHPGKAEMSEAEFITRLCETADCKLMLDINNAYVNAINFNFDVNEWLASVPLNRVVQIHVAGHERVDDLGVAVDTHGAPVPNPVLALLENVLRQTGPVPVVLERDQKIPPLAELLAEVRTIQQIWKRATKT